MKIPMFSSSFNSFINILKHLSFPNSLISIDFISAAKKILESLELFVPRGKL